MLATDGSVWDWGCNTRGQLGIGTIGTDAWSSVPVNVELPEPAKQVGSGTCLCWALSANGGSIYTWGDNTRGQLGIGDPSVKYSDTPVQVDVNLPPGVTVVSVASGLWSMMALLSNGEVMAWGDNVYGECGLNPRTAGDYIYTPTIIPGLTGVTALAAGDFYSMALTSNGTVLAWGQNTYGQLGPEGSTTGTHPHSYVPVRVTGLPPITQIVAGGNNGAAVDARGKVWEWGRNKFGELGNGVVEGTDAPNPTPKMVRGLPPVVSVASQGPTMLATDASGQVYAWGFNKWGAVGDGQTADTGTPTHVMTVPIYQGLPDTQVQVAAAHRSSYAFNTYSGEMYAWGENNYGQLGIAANDSPNPLPVNITSEIQAALSDPSPAAQSASLAPTLAGLSANTSADLLPAIGSPELLGSLQTPCAAYGDALTAAGSPVAAALTDHEWLGRPLFFVNQSPL